MIIFNNIFGKCFEKNKYSHSAQQMREVFIETPPMATHQVSFIVSSFNGTSSGNGSGIYAFTHTDYADQIQYVSDEAPRLVKAMEEFTGISYDLPKLDLFAIPDFKSDGMGNWGLTTYRYYIMHAVKFVKNVVELKIQFIK